MHSIEYLEIKMANFNATGKKPKYGHELTQRTRKIILSALDIVDGDEKKPMREILAAEAKLNPLKFMELASKFCLKDVVVDINDARDRAEELTDSELADIVAARSKETEDSPTIQNIH